MKRTDYRLYTATIVTLSGVRVGGSDDLLQIGGADLTVIKHPVTRQPYLPGSSIKGKMRSELEKAGEFDSSATDQPCKCGECLICRVFGPHMSPQHKLGPTRIIVRDAPVIGEATIESKASTAINRETGSAFGGSLRTEERVSAGSRFALEIGLQIFDIDNLEELQEVVKEGLKLLELSGIGAGVGKGSGKIRLDNKDIKTEAQIVATLSAWPKPAAQPAVGG